ncbi:penicillin amidase [Modestobacter sp. DSM 44400]|uniref:penicillin acylase family protein n=1 Tax=Modestobacter sp. DSM 44400 TaxID=1550230 RepID=UPI0008944149|nr:penicillin acylase family protein [Modestobacter sp. DSM 44400]SDY93804.1 penicillin amidase [Modestobacter sp. DSM 44400]
MTTDGEYTLAGLEGPAEILIDRWGVPHMYASTLYDVFRVQGFNAARDRLWQLDFWRRRGLGLLAEVFGPSMVERDRASRLFRYRGDMQAEWLSYGSDTQRVATAFVDGVNAYIRLVSQDRELLPLEFRELGYAPALWAPEDLARIRSNGLYSNLDSEVARALILRDHDPRVEDLRRRREPPVDLVVPEGLDLSLIPDDVQRVYRLAIDPPDLGGIPETVLQGSNNWVLAPDRTTTGRPLLANDPHRALSVPSLRYLAHLSAPGLDVIGAGEPALPGISIGHNGRIAFGLTIFSIDQEDLYVYRTNPDDPLEYRYQDRWEPMRVVREIVHVEGGEDVEVELRYTRHGPVIYEDVERHTAFAVRAAWLEPGMAPYLGSMEYMRATNWDDFLAAMNRWGAPPENQLFADPSGHIGWKPAGRTPIRPNWNGTLPVPGDGRYEWAGFRDMEELPVASNPERGWLATANEMNLPEDYPAYDKVISFDWSPSSRAERLAQVFEGDRKFSPEDCVRLQSDFVSVPARLITRRLLQVTADEATIGDALQLLTAWDGDLNPDSAPGALFEVWHRRHLRPALLRRAVAQLVPADHVEAVVTKLTPDDSQLADPRVDLAILERPGDWLGEDADAVLDEILRTTLTTAVAEVEQLLGSDREQWAWGRLHVSRLEHPLSPLMREETVARLAVGPAPRGGSGDTVGNTAYLADSFVQTGGATFRIVVDVGDWDGSLVMNSPGQSGDPDSPHHSDLFEAWSRGEAFPLYYSRERVESVTERRISLRPLDEPTGPSGDTAGSPAADKPS